MGRGPAWFPAAQMLIFSDIPAHRMMRWTAQTGCSIFREDSGYSNGNTRDTQGRLVTCHHGLRAVTRTEHDGSLTVLADQAGGKRLNSPNDAVVRSDGSVWFTDPTYGILSDLEGYRADPEQPGSHVWRIPPMGGEAHAVITDFTQPNGLCFSPDERLLYVAESGSSHDPGVAPVIRVFDVGADGTVGAGRDFATIDAGLPDGIRCDARGTCGLRRPMGCMCLRPTARCWARYWSPRSCRTCALAGRAATGCSSPRRPAFTCWRSMPVRRTGPPPDAVLVSAAGWGVQPAASTALATASLLAGFCPVISAPSRRTKGDQSARFS